MTDDRTAGFNDAWDDIVDFEKDSYAEGYAEGFADAAGGEREMYHNGINAGFTKGYGVAIEMGFMLSAVEEFMKKNEGRGRHMRKAQQLIDKYTSFPECNDPNFDFEAAIQELRSLYRSIPTGILDLAASVRREGEGIPEMSW
jgi:hypothetical protein